MDEPKLVLTTKYIKRLREKLPEYCEMRAKYEAEIENIECPLRDLQDIRCVICGKFIFWIGGRKPKYCKFCKLFVAKEQAKEYAKDNAEKVREAAKEAMRKRRKLFIPRDD